MPRISLLVADDVGLGKTIETGLVLSELILRRRVRRVLILCPASLRTQWEQEMAEKFALGFDLVDREAAIDLRRRLGPDANPWRTFSKIIASYHYLKQLDVWEEFRAASKTQPGSPSLSWDLLIVDDHQQGEVLQVGNFERIRGVVGDDYEYSSMQTRHVPSDSTHIECAASTLVDDSTASHHDQPITEFQQLVQVLAQKQDGCALVSGFQQTRVNEFNRGKVQPKAGIGHDQDPSGSFTEFSGQYRALHVAAGELGKRGYLGGRLYVESLYQSASMRTDLPVVQPPAPTRQGGAVEFSHRQILSNRHRRHAPELFRRALDAAPRKPPRVRVDRSPTLLPLRGSPRCER